MGGGGGGLRRLEHPLGCGIVPVKYPHSKLFFPVGSGGAGPRERPIS